MAQTFGRYKLLHKLGRGGMAEVFLARLGEGPVAKLLAVKRLLPAYSRNKRVVNRLAAEARLTVWLTHPNVVQVFDFGKVQESYYIAMEYVDGCDLRSLIQPPSQSPIQLPLEVALDVAYRILDALRYAHGCTDGAGRPLGIIHRDVSPHNVLVSRDGHPKLADFGVARAVVQEQHTQPGAILGKFSYMAPEQARRGEYDARVDIYAAGAVLYQMLTGSKPFPDRTSLQEAVRRQLPPPPSSLRPSIPPALDALVLRAMAPLPGDRYATAAEMADAALEQLQQVGGPPKPHQISKLVEETIRLRQSKGGPEGEGASRADVGPGEDSLIGAEVTRVQRHIRLPKLQPEQVVEEEPTPADPGRLPETAPWGEGPATTPEGLAGIEEEVTDVPLPSHRGVAGIEEEVTDVPLPPHQALAGIEEEVTDVPRRSPPEPVAVSAPAVAAAPPAHSLLDQFRSLPRGTRLLVVWGLGASAVLVIFGLGLMVGRWTVKNGGEGGRAPAAAARPRTTGPATMPAQPSRASVAAPPADPEPARPVRRAPATLPAKVAASDRPLAKASRSGKRKRPAPQRRARRVAAATEEAGPFDDWDDEDEVEPAKVRASKPVRSKRREKAQPQVPQPTGDSGSDLTVPLLREAQHAYVAGNHARAVEMARQVLRRAPGNDSAWQILGGSSCYLKKRRQAKRAFDRLDLKRRDLLRAICKRNGIEL